MAFSSEAELRAVLLRAAVGTSEQPSWGDDGGQRFVWFAREERAIPLLSALVNGWPADAPAELRQEVRQLQGTAMMRCVELEHHASEVVSALGRVGIEHALLKGIATAHLDYPDPSMREFSDIDLLVSPERLAEAMTVLAAEGWAQGYALPRYHQEFTHAVTLVKGRIELDLHQRIAHRALGLLVPTQELLRDRVPLALPALESSALSATDRLIHAAIHSATSNIPQRRRVSSLADVLVLASSGGLDPSAVLGRADSWSLRPIVAAEIELAYESAGLVPSAEWMRCLAQPSRRRNRLVERAYLSPARRPVVEELAYLRLLPGWGRRARYVIGYLTPEADYARQHGRSDRWSQVRYLLHKLRKG